MLMGGTGMYKNDRERKWNGPSKAIPLSLLEVKNELKKKVNSNKFLLKHVN